jgi:hypothetical protein
MAHKTDLLTDHEMVIAKALPKVIPDFTTSFLVFMMVFPSVNVISESSS